MWDIAERVLIAIITAGVTVRLSLRNFSTQKWWEKQAEVYSATLESLSHMKHYIDDYLRREEMHESIPAERREMLFRRWRDSKDRIEQVTHVGAFIISDDAEAHLKMLRRELDAADKGFRPTGMVRRGGNGTRSINASRRSENAPGKTSEMLALCFRRQ